jgi:hypothetical protein
MCVLLATAPTLLDAPLLKTRIGGELAEVVLSLWAISTLRTLLTAICVTVQRRHLMVWAIFAPKFVFDSVIHVMLCGFMLVAWALVVSLEGPPGESAGDSKAS